MYGICSSIKKFVIFSSLADFLSLFLKNTVTTIFAPLLYYIIFFKILQQKNQHLTQLATKDLLTGIHNRHMFGELFSKEFSVFKRDSTKLSLMMLELDHFKLINDTYGHNIGDVVLKEFAELVSSSVREADIFARWGGEEFVLLLRNAGCEEAFGVGEKIRILLENSDFGEVGKVTCSIGITEIQLNDTLESAMERADSAMYQAKTQGRNQTGTCEASR